MRKITFLVGKKRLKLRENTESDVIWQVFIIGGDLDWVADC